MYTSIRSKGNRERRLGFDKLPGNALPRHEDALLSALAPPLGLIAPLQQVHQQVGKVAFNGMFLLTDQGFDLLHQVLHIYLVPQFVVHSSGLFLRPGVKILVIQRLAHGVCLPYCASHPRY